MDINKNYKIAIASGKGGTGKTLIATNLAYIASEKNSVTLFDLDVEEPNDHLFLNNVPGEKEVAQNMIPKINLEKCTYCGQCNKVCEYHAIITLADNVLVFPELCHSCYACLEMCPEMAISEDFKHIGEIYSAAENGLKLITGRLKAGETATTALISKTKQNNLCETDYFFYDAPPGTSCPVIESLKDADYILLVAEPTPFGLHDLDLIFQTTKILHKKTGVIINKAVKNNNIIEQYCLQNNLEILLRIPLSSKIAREYAQGNLASKKISACRMDFEKLLDIISAKMNGEEK